jgi:hypothetical protein
VNAGTVVILFYLPTLASPEREAQIKSGTSQAPNQKILALIDLTKA